MSRWIPIKERLPEVFCDSLGNLSSESVLVQCEGGWITIAYLNPIPGGPVFEQMESDGPVLVGTMDDIVAWMPLPKPYKGESKNGKKR